MGLFGLFGSESSSSSRSETNSANKTIDARLGIEGGNTGQVVSQGAVVGNPGSITTGVGDFATVTQTLSGDFKMGMSGAEVKDLVSNVQESAQQTSQLVSDFGSKALSAVSQATTGEATDLTRYVPYLAVALIAYVALRAKRR
jgi:hypothetical protein